MRRKTQLAFKLMKMGWLLQKKGETDWLTDFKKHYMNSDTGADNVTSLPYLPLFLFVVYKSFGCNLPRIKIHALESYNSVVFSIFMESCTVTTNLGGWRREAANPPESPGTFTIPEDEGRCWESQREGTCQLSPPLPPGPGDASVCLCKDRLSCDPDKPEIHNMTVCTTGWPNEGDAGALERWLTPRDETLASKGFKELLLVNDEVGGWGELGGAQRLCRASLVAQMVKNPLAMRETWVRPLGQEAPLEEGMTTHSSILAWRVPWTEEPGGLESTQLQRVGHD